MAIGLKMGGVMPGPAAPAAVDPISTYLGARKHPGTLRTIVGYLGDALSRSAGGPSIFANALQQRDEEDGFLKRALLQSQLEAQKPRLPQGVSLGNGGYAEYTPGGGFNVLREPTPNEPPAVAVARAAGLTPGTQQWQAALTAAIPGYANTQQVIDARAASQRDLASYRSGLALSNKQAPTYSQMHPKAPGSARSGGARYEYRMSPDGQLQRRRIG